MSQQQMNMNIRPEDVTPIACECGCNLFTEVVKLGSISPLLVGAPTNNPIIVPVGKALMCIKCHKPFDPQEHSGVDDAEFSDIITEDTEKKPELKSNILTLATR
jgi:hypothetical protein